MDTQPISRDDIRSQVEALGPWFHNLELGGVRTAPSHFLGDYPAVKWQAFADAIPQDLTGCSVLDIGCNAGFYSLEMKRRGARRVVAVDSEDLYIEQARFAARMTGLDIEIAKLSVYDIAALGERFDIVLFMGVLYHLRHPLLALDLIHAHAARDLMVFQSMQRGSQQVEPIDDDYDFWVQEHFDAPGYPKLHFVEKRYSNDASNWWIPNRACVEAMLRSAGFEITAHPEQEVYICRRGQPAPGAHAVYARREDD
ncbi:MAG TPA: TIGR04290 family methyltransferase [Pseudolabrys sp.]|nr:TIGR04290 family methyltransferase [Pseudolabrys sp.]